MRIGPQDKLTPGTKVQVQGKRGVIVRAEDSRDQHGGSIVVHYVKYTEVFSHTHQGKSVYKQMKKPATRPCNYSFINTLD